MPSGQAQFRRHAGSRHREYGRLIRLAQQKHGIPARVLAGLIEQESGFNPAAVSSANAQGLTQFIPSTAASYNVKYGTGHGAVASQIMGAAKYLKDLGFQKDPQNALGRYYGSTSASYKSEVLDKAEKYRGIGKGAPAQGGSRSRGSTRTNLSEVTSTQPGTDNSALRQSLKLSYLENRNDPNALLSLAQGLQGAKDVAPTSRTTVTASQSRSPGSRDISGGPQGKLPGTETTLSDALSKAERADKLNKAGKLPYLWGGGHGSTPAKVGQPVDCSGFVSQVLGVSPRVSGQFASWGKPGKGRNITVYANSGHVLMSIRDPRSGKVRFFGTSGSNPGGGAGEMPTPSASYLSSFTARHPG